jgi:hypothetical protein
MKLQKQIRYKIYSCDNLNITLQVLNKSSLFNITWEEFLMPEYLCYISKSQIFHLGIYYAKNMQNICLKTIFSKDYEVVEMKKMILSEFRGGNYLILDIKTNKLDTISSKFILDNLEILVQFTSLQSFFLGLREGFL